MIQRGPDVFHDLLFERMDAKNAPAMVKAMGEKPRVEKR
jgi:hypothetical protein